MFTIATPNKPAKIHISSKFATWNGHSFILDYDYSPTKYSEQVHNLLLSIIASAIQEYAAFKYSRDYKDRKKFRLARDFLFDDNYTIALPGAPNGQSDITLPELTEQLGMNIEFIREVAKKYCKQVNKGRTYESGTQLDLFDVLQ